MTDPIFSSDAQCDVTEATLNTATSQKAVDETSEKATNTTLTNSASATSTDSATTLMSSGAEAPLRKRAPGTAKKATSAPKNDTATSPKVGTAPAKAPSAKAASPASQPAAPMHKASSAPKSPEAQPAKKAVAPKKTFSKPAKNAERITVDEPANSLPSITLADLSPTLQTACANAGWASLMPVQERSLPYLLQGRDIMVQSRTGSGKTGAYLLPLMARLDPKKAAVQALVLVPTRELASQVEQEAKTLFRGSGFSVAAVYGGVGYGKQIDALRQGVTLVVGTPGRVLDHLLKRTLVLKDVSELVFDEADRMLSIGFYPDMKEIQRYLPPKQLHATLFSATYPPHVLKLAGEFLHEPELLSLSSSQVHVAEVQHTYYECKSMDKDRTLLRILEVENPTSAIIFCNTKANVHFVTAVLQGFGFNADELSADLSQNRREAVLGRLRQGQIRFLVATDVAARGIDIPELSHVILYEPPDDRESYIHRSGRTGRAGAAGVVISLVDIMQKLELQRIAKFYKIPMLLQQVPTDAEVNSAVALRVTAILEARFRQLTGLELERLKRFGPLASEMAVDPEQAQLLTMLLDDSYQRSLNPSASSAPRTMPVRPAPRDNGTRRSGPRSFGRGDGRSENRGDSRGGARGDSRDNRDSRDSRSENRGDSRDTRIGENRGENREAPRTFDRDDARKRSKPEGHRKGPSSRGTAPEHDTPAGDRPAVRPARASRPKRARFGADNAGTTDSSES